MSQTPPCTSEGTRIVSIDEARTALVDAFNEEVVVCLEDWQQAREKLKAGNADQLWVWDGSDGAIRRPDRKFHEARVGNEQGYNALAIYEEPANEIPQTEDGSPRVIGHVVIKLNAGSYAILLG